MYRSQILPFPHFKFSHKAQRHLFPAGLFLRSICFISEGMVEKPPPYKKGASRESMLSQETPVLYGWTHRVPSLMFIIRLPDYPIIVSSFIISSFIVSSLPRRFYQINDQQQVASQRQELSVSACHPCAIKNLAVKAGEGQSGTHYAHQRTAGNEATGQ